MKRSQILIMGGVERENGYELGPGKYYGKAKMLRLDLHSGEFEEILSMTEGNENFPSEYPNLEYTAGTVENNTIWMVTDTEIRQYNYPELNLLKLFSYPCFHNIHSVAVYGENLYVTSTGLDMVVVLNKNTGKIIQQINTEGKEIWHRFSPDVDYRKIHSTRPHDCHPNYVFFINKQPWVTRCTQGDAVCLTDFSQCIDISGPDKEISVHDGVKLYGKIYFTSVDGCIVIVDELKQTVIENINLYDYKEFKAVRGWCRGLYIKDDLMYIGFSHLRKTRAKNKLRWVKNKVKSLVVEKVLLSSVVVFDLKKREVVADYHIPEGMLDAVYAILPEPDL